MTEKTEALIFLNGIEWIEPERQPKHCFVAHEYPEEEPDDYREHIAVNQSSIDVSEAQVAR